MTGSATDTQMFAGLAETLTPELLRSVDEVGAVRVSGVVGDAEYTGLHNEIAAIDDWSLTEDGIGDVYRTQRFLQLEAAANGHPTIDALCAVLRAAWHEAEMSAADDDFVYSGFKMGERAASNPWHIDGRKKPMFIVETGANATTCVRGLRRNEERFPTEPGSLLVIGGMRQHMISKAQTLGQERYSLNVRINDN